MKFIAVIVVAIAVSAEEQVGQGVNADDAEMLALAETAARPAPRRGYEIRS